MKKKHTNQNLSAKVNKTKNLIGPNSIPYNPHGFFFQPPVYPVPTLQASAGAIDYVEFVFNATTLNWECITKV